MKGTIMNFRSARHHQKDNQMIISVEGIESKDEAAELVGKSVVFRTDGSKEIKGEIRAIHGNKGAVRALFEKGMPGQAISKKVEVQ
ncbi:MAG: 50S ribosomal protein L35ae [Nanobdellota archaeon]